jgi:hypothetical protein
MTADVNSGDCFPGRKNKESRQTAGSLAQFRQVAEFSGSLPIKGLKVENWLV